MCFAYKLIAMDVDGTLLGKHGALPEENVRVIRHLYGKGVNFVIATGRNDIQVERLACELGIEPLIIGCNGASVRDLKKGINYVYEYMRNDSLQKLMDLAEEASIPLRMFSLEHYYLAFAAHEDLDKKKEKQASTYTGLILGDGSGIPIDSFEHLLTYRDNIIKAVIVNGDFEKILSIQKKIEDIPGLASFRSSLNCLDVVKTDVSKGSALKILGEQLGVRREEIVAIGDSENDIPMLEYAGYAVVMGNGEEKVKELADLVTETNINAGVAHALKKIFSV